MKPIKLDDKEINRAVETGEKYVQIGDRKYFLMEVEEIKEPYVYVVNDPEEEKRLLEALNTDNPIINDEEIIKMLRKQ